MESLKFKDLKLGMVIEWDGKPAIVTDVQDPNSKGNVEFRLNTTVGVHIQGMSTTVKVLMSPPVEFETWDVRLLTMPYGTFSAGWMGSVCSLLELEKEHSEYRERRLNYHYQLQQYYKDYQELKKAVDETEYTKMLNNNK